MGLVNGFSAFDRVFFHSIFTNFTVAGPIVTDKEFFPVTVVISEQFLVPPQF